MLSVNLIAVGKLGQDWLREGCSEYVKRMAAFCKLSIIEIAECRLPENPSQAQIRAGILSEGEKILEKIPAGSYIISMCIEGRQLDSESLAKQIRELPVYGKSNVTLIVGGSHGLSERVKVISHLRLSMSPMTFPHQLARLMLLEQLYRAFSINSGSKYHK